jgi:3-oxoacyl-[acyl-carrier-protein] synthase II
MFSLHNRRAVITGLGVLAPNGNDKESFWSTLLEGKSGIGPVTLFDASDLRCRIAGEVKGFDPARYIDPEFKPKRMARASQFAVAASSMALTDAGLSPADLLRFEEVPLVMGVSTTAMDLTQARPRPWTAVTSIPNAMGSAVVYTLGINARLLTLSTGCASGLDAVAAAAASIKNGKAEVAIAGAADAAVVRYVFECFSGARKLSRRNDEPEKANRPFDRDRDGGVISEGAAMMILESLEHAKARNAEPYCEVSGYGSCADPIDSAEGGGLEKAMHMALDNAPASENQVDCISAHGPGDQHMDRYETELIKKTFGKRAYRIPVSSIKGVTGNPMGVGCAHQLVAAALSIKNETVPPTTNLENADPDCDLDYVPAFPRQHKLKNVLVNTHGFGRGNSSMLLERVS